MDNSSCKRIVLTDSDHTKPWNRVVLDINQTGFSRRSERAQKHVAWSSNKSAVLISEGSKVGFCLMATNASENEEYRIRQIHRAPSQYWRVVNKSLSQRIISYSVITESTILILWWAKGKRMGQKAVVSENLSSNQEWRRSYARVEKNRIGHTRGYGHSREKITAWDTKKADCVVCDEWNSATRAIWIVRECV